MHTNWFVLIEISMEIGMLNFWLGLLVTALTKETYFNLSVLVKFKLLWSSKKTWNLENMYVLFFYSNVFELCILRLKYSLWLLSPKKGTGKSVSPRNSSYILITKPKLYIPSTLNIDFILWHTQSIVCALKC